MKCFRNLVMKKRLYQNLLYNADFSRLNFQLLIMENASYIGLRRKDTLSGKTTLSSCFCTLLKKGYSKYKNLLPSIEVRVRYVEISDGFTIWYMQISWGFSSPVVDGKLV